MIQQEYKIVAKQVQHSHDGTSHGARLPHVPDPPSQCWSLSSQHCLVNYLSPASNIPPVVSCSHKLVTFQRRWSGTSYNILNSLLKARLYGLYTGVNKIKKFFRQNLRDTANSCTHYT